MKKESAQGNLLLTLAAIVWGVSFVFQRTGMDHIGPLVFNGIRMIISAVAMVILILIVRGKKGLHIDKATLRAGLLCGLFMFGGNVTQQTGLQYTTAGKSGFLTALYMVLVPVIRFVIFRKKESKLTWFGVAVGVLGLYLLCVSESFTVVLTDLWFLGCALCYALLIICADRVLEKSDPLHITLLQFVVSGVLSLALALFTEGSTTTLSGILEARTAILFCALFAGVGGYTLQMVGQKKTEPTIASLLMSLESVFAVLSGWLFLKETMSVREVAGCVIMFVAVLLVQAGEKK